MAQESTSELSLGPLALEQRVYDVLTEVIDPEVGENIVDLGLVYDIQVENRNVTIALTMTSAACPMGEMLLDDIDATLTRKLPGDMVFDVQLVWDPPWSPDMISPEAKQRLGWD